MKISDIVPLNEVSMSPSSLKSMAATTNAQVGIEFELYVDGNTLDIPSNTVEVNLDNVEVNDIASFCGLWDNDTDVLRSDVNAMETELRNAFKKWLDYDIVRLANNKFSPDDDSEEDDTAAEKERLEELISITGDHLMSDNIDKFVAPVIEKYSKGLDAFSIKALEYFLTNAPVKLIINSAKTAYTLSNVNITKSPLNSDRYPPPSEKFKFPRAVKSDKYSTHYSGLKYEGSSVYMDLLNGDDLTDSDIFFKRPWRTDGPTSLKFRNGEWQAEIWSLDGENLCPREEYEAKKGPYTGQMLPDNILEFIEIHKNLISTGIMDSAYDDMDQILNQSAREEILAISNGDDLFSKATNGLAEKVKKDYYEFARAGVGAGNDNLQALFLEEVLPRIKRNAYGQLDVSWFIAFNRIVELKAYNRGFDRSTLTGEEDEDDLNEITGYYIELGQISVPPHPTEPEEDEDGYNIDDEKKLAAIASALEQYVGKTVKHGDYHSHSSGASYYRVEADSSLRDKNGSEDAAAEIIMPYMHISKAYEQIEHILRFCKDHGCYTNDSTGLHINLSVPDQDEVDYLKLILFMGDQYVLQTFDREFNQYCKSSFNKIIHTLNGGQKFDSVSTHVGKILDGIKNNTVNLAQRAIQEKYSSVHLQSGWVEFRGPGNDWLHGGLDLILNTVNRFAVAMDIAADPNKYKNEYMKKLYKLISSHYPEIDNIAQISAIYLSSNGDDGRKRQALKALLQQTNNVRALINDPMLTKNNIDLSTKVKVFDVVKSCAFNARAVRDYFTNLFHKRGITDLPSITCKVTMPSEQVGTTLSAYSTAHALAKFLEFLNRSYGIDAEDSPEELINEINIEQF